MINRHEAVVRIPQGEVDRINTLLSLNCFENMTDEEMSAVGAKLDSYEGIFVASFDDGSALTYDLCSGSGNYFDNAIWKSADGKEEVVLDCQNELGSTIEVSKGTEQYVVRVETH